MKRIFIALFAFSAFAASAQSKVFCLQPSCNQTINVGDSAFIFAQLTASDGYGNMTWSQKSGPAMVIPTTKLASAGASGTQSGFGVRPTVAGTYIFSVTGMSFTGSSGTTLDTLFVNAAAKRIAYITVTYTDSTRVKTQ